MTLATPVTPPDEDRGFAALQLFLEAYWERGGRRSDDIAVLLGGLALDPAQRADWAAACAEACKRSSAASS